MKTVAELEEITCLGKSAIYNVINKIESFEGTIESTFTDLYEKPSSKVKNKSEVHSQIRTIFGNDKSLT